MPAAIETDPTFLQEQKTVCKPAGTLNSLVEDADIISPVSTDAQRVRDALRADYDKKKEAANRTQPIVHIKNSFRHYNSMV